MGSECCCEEVAKENRRRTSMPLWSDTESESHTDQDVAMNVNLILEDNAAYMQLFNQH